MTFNINEAFEVEGLLIGGSAAIFAADLAPITGDYPEAPSGSQCIVPGDGVFTKYSDGSWRRSEDSGVELDELILYRNGEPELCFFREHIARVRL